MNKKFGFWTLTFLVIANMVGAGVFTTSGFSLGDLGSPHLVVLAWLVGGVIAITGAISYGMLVRAMPESGGEYLFLSRAAHPLLGFIAGWVSLIAGFSGAIALSATAFEEYALPQPIRPDWLPNGAVAVTSIILAGVFHGLKPSVGAIAQNAVVLLKLGLLTIMLLFAATKLSTDSWHGFTSSGPHLTGLTLASVFAKSLVWISLSYAGFNAAVYIAGEVEDAPNLVPKSLFAGTLIVLVLYVLLNSVFVYSTPANSIKFKDDVAAIAAKSLGGSGFEMFVRATIASCLLTSVLSMMMAAPRVYAKMADDGMMPGPLRFQGESPMAATVLQVVLAAGLVIASTLQGLLSYLSLTLSLSAASSVCCLLLPSVRKNPLFHFSHVAPAFFVVTTLLSAAFMTTYEPSKTRMTLLGTFLTFAVGAVAYWAANLFNKKTF